MELCRHLLQEEGDTVRLVRFGGAFDDPRPARQQPDQSQFQRVVEPVERCRGERRVIEPRVWKLLGGVAHDRSRAGMRVLHVENRIVLRLLGDLGEIEFERLIVFSRQHDEAENVLADLVDDLA